MKRIKIIKEKKGKRFCVLVHGQIYHRFDEGTLPITLLKRGVSSEKACSFVINQIPLKHAIAGPKKADVDSLLVQLYGETWRECEHFSSRDLYLNIIDGLATLPEVSENANEEAAECDCLEDDHGLHI